MTEWSGTPKGSEEALWMLDGLADECHSYQSDVMFLDIRVAGLFPLPTFVGAKTQCQHPANTSLFLKVVLIP